MTEIRHVGDHALLIQLQDNEAVHAAARAARDRFGDQLVEVVPGHETLLLVWDEGMEDAERRVQFESIASSRVLSNWTRTQSAKSDLLMS